MIIPEDIPALVRRLVAANIKEFECSWPEGALRLRIAAPEAAKFDGVQTARPVEATTAQESLKSPGIGIFRLVHPLGALQPIAKGDHLDQGQVVGYLETDGIFLPIYTKQSGTMERWLVDDGHLTGYSTPLLAFF